MNFEHRQRFLRCPCAARAGHDVVAVAELWPRTDDSIVMERAVRGARILITEDKDFGHLVYAKMRKTGGVMLIRFPAGSRGSLVDTVLNVVEARGTRLVGSFRHILKLDELRWRGPTHAFAACVERLGDPRVCSSAVLQHKKVLVGDLHTGAPTK